MARQDSQRDRGVWCGLPIVLTAAMIWTGCAPDRRPLRVDGISRSSTIGSDFRKVPAGTTIPAAGFGVDLVNRPGEPPTRDDAMTRAVHESPVDPAR